MSNKLTLKTRVLLLAEYCNPNHVGTPYNSFMLAEQLVARPDLAVTLVTASANEPSLKRTTVGTAARMAYVDLSSQPPWSYRLCQQWLDRKFRWSPTTVLEILRYRHFEHAARQMLAPEINGGQFDIIHRLSPTSMWLPSPLGNWSELPLVLGPLTRPARVPPEYATQLTGEVDRWRRLTASSRWWSGQRRTFRRAAAVICASQYTAQAIPSFYYGRLFRIPDCCADNRLLDQPRTWEAPQRGRFRFISIGPLVKSQGHWLTLTAWKNSEYLRNAELIIVGDGPEKRTIGRMIQEFGLADNVQLISFLDRNNVADQLSQAQVFVAPSLVENDVAPLLDAMASGLPTIVLKCGQPGEIVNEQCGIALPVAEEAPLVNDLQTAMEGLMASPRLCQEYSQNAKAHMRQHYRWTTQAAKIHQVYRQILEPDESTDVPKARRAILAGLS